jgi:hypothetical protein
VREFILSSNQQSLTAAIVYYVTPSTVIESDAIQVSSVLLSPLFEHIGSHPGPLSDIESAIRARRVTRVWSSVHRVPAGIESRSSPNARFWDDILIDVGKGELVS